MQRTPVLAQFVDALHAAIAARAAPQGPARCLMDEAMRRLRSGQGAATAAAPHWLPACGHLAGALVASHAAAPDIVRLAGLLDALAPQLHWRRRADGGDARFLQGHANAHIVGPLGLEVRHDLVIGATLMAPGVPYPEHRHPPREVYLVLSPGDWWRGGQDWHAPGVGGLVYHPGDAPHAMRAAPTAPLLALWCLLPSLDG